MKTFAFLLLLTALAVAEETNQPPVPAAPPVAATNSAPTAPAPGVPNPRVDTLLSACEKGDLAQVTALVEQGVPINARASSKLALTPLVHSADCGKLDIVIYLLSKGAQIDLVSGNGSTALLCAVYRKHHDCALALIGAGADVNLANKTGYFPLLYAAESGTDEVLYGMIARQANVNASSKKGCALAWAVGAHRTAALKILLDAGAKPQPKEAKAPYSILAVAARNEDSDMVDLFLSHGFDINEAGEDGVTPLMGSLFFGKSDRVLHILEKGGDPNRQDKEGRTALMILAGSPISEAQRDAMLKGLLDHHADVNLTNLKGETALILAGSAGKVSMVEALKASGAKETEVHLAAWPQPSPPLSRAQAWALAVGTIYAQTNGGNPNILGYGGYPEPAQGMLKRDWGVTDRKSFLDAMESLLQEGMRSEFLTAGKKVGEIPESEFKAKTVLFTDEKLAPILAVRESYLKWKDKTGLAWDLCRADNLVSLAYAAKYINESEAWGLLSRIARTTQKSFRSWQEMSDNFLDGRKIWAGQSSPKFVLCSQLLLDPKEANSPWNQLPWQTDLMQAGD